MQKDDEYAWHWISFLLSNPNPEDENFAAKLEKEKKDQHFIAEDGCVHRKFQGKTGKVCNKV